VHKGLDLVLEAFAQMPEYHLTVCGPIENEKDFQVAFHKELYQTSNIQTLGWIDIKSEQFVRLARVHTGIIYPSCSEGGGGSVIACLHAGLIPILTYESSIDVMDFGLILPDASIDSIKNSIASIAALPHTELKHKSKEAWKFARSNHTRDRFSEAYQDFVANVLGLS
jgi:glycosyltransferase involved in cell wall biosynthesis